MKDNDKKQAIKEMAEVIRHFERLTWNVVGACPSPKMYAQELYRKGFRKQSEGEWMEQVRVSKEGKPLLRHYKCNLCGVYLATQANFCPNCGAKMEGGAE